MGLILKLKTEVVAGSDGWWLVVMVEGQPEREVGPFATEGGARSAHADLLEMLEQLRLSKS
jgi:hypothetical protein